MFVRGPNPIWFFDDLVGQPFDDTYFAFFLTNDLPYVPQAVYQDPNGQIPWSNPIEFQPSSGLPNNLYFNPSLVYRIEMRQGPDQTYPLIWLIQNYVVGTGSGGGGGNSDVLITASNLITNPQFADVLFTSPYTISAPGTYDIAIGWQLVVVGTGTTTLTQETNTGDEHIVGNPPYALTIASSGQTSVQLIQTFSNNGAIFSGGAVAVAFTAVATSSTQVVTISYQPSTGIGKTLITQSVPAGQFENYEDAIDIPLSTSADIGEAAFVNIGIALPSDGSLSITNLQLTGQSLPLSAGFIANPTPPLFQEITYERVVDQEFHVYQNSIMIQPKQNLLTGWNFGQNPWQFTSTTSANLGSNTYTADQTIIVQQQIVAINSPNNVLAGQGTEAQNSGFVITGVTATNQFAMIQYIDSKTMAQYFGQVVSSMVTASLVNSNSVPIQFKMRMATYSGYPPTIGQNQPIASWPALGEPVFASGWTPIVPLNDPVYILSPISQDFPFDQFQLPSVSAVTTVAVMIYTLTNLDIPNTILFNEVSLVSNSFAMKASSETFDETLRKCQFYYEKSYPFGILPGTPSPSGLLGQTYIEANRIVFGTGIYRQSFSFQFKQTKATIPGVTLYSPLNGQINTIYIFVNANGLTPASANDSIGNWTSSPSFDNIFYTCINLASLVVGYNLSLSSEGLLAYQYAANSIIGR